MKIVFDENVPWPLRQFLFHHDVTSVQREGHGGAENGDLLKLLDGSFDVFVMCDKNMRYQQNLDSRVIAIVELPTNRWPILKDMCEKIVKSVGDSTPGSYILVE